MTALIRQGARSAAQSYTLEQAFPNVPWRITPLGSQVIVQLRRTKKITRGGIVLTAESKDADTELVRVGIVRAMGPIAYKKRDSLVPWPEGAWVKVGDYVRVPAHAGIDSWRIEYDFEEKVGEQSVKVEDWVRFSSFNDYDIKGLIEGDPLEIVDYV